MLKTHEKFYSANGKRLILVADDEQINREILGAILESKYELLFAENGLEALKFMEENKETLSLVLLDLMMPVLSGLELLKRVKENPELQRVPVIVLTSDQTAEIESLRLGAIDFISKPYPQAGVIQARVQRTIELSEDQQIIQSTERDPLTGLYNREYFYRYAEQFDQHHKEMDMDAIVVDVNHFHMINERYGKAYGDGVLRRIGEKVRDTVLDAGGIVCRQEGDTFMIYTPHRTDYKDILESASVGLTGEEQANNRVRLRMGVYSTVDKSIDIERRFDRAKSASDTVRGSFTRPIAFYDNALHEAELYQERLIEDFHRAIREEQFIVFYQPKFNVRTEIPVLASAEALVRWQHPELGMISPAVFIPLFEENGLIQALDTYVWAHAAAQIKDWKERLGISVPVSVNVSRIDMYDPNLVETFQSLLEKYGLLPEEFLLEITESAYTEDSAQIISTVNRLRDLGFRIEMDDFGTGYSSLNMISSLPIDALKLDMKFIRNAFQDGKDTRLIEVIIDIANYLGVPVIAEGVETEEQLNALKAMGCDIVQGYYFSKPVPAAEYEVFVEEKKRQMENVQLPRETAALDPAGERTVSTSIAHALTSGFEVIYYVDTQSGQYVQFSAQGRYEDLQIERSGADFFGDTQRNIPRVVCPEDQARVSLSMQKDALLAQLMGGHHFSMTYRLVINGQPVYYNLRAVNAHTRDDHHIVIGVSNVEEQMKTAIDTAGGKEHSNEFFNIAQALSSDFESIYYINVETDSYTEFTAQGSYENLQIETSGEDFFKESQKNLLTVVYPEDQGKVSAALQKDALLDTLKKQQTVSILYRLMIDGTPTYYRMKAVRVEGDGSHIVIGVSNVNAQVAREREYEAARLENQTYERILQALSKDYYSIYLVNTETDEFIEYSSHSDYQDLHVEQSGVDFFGDCKRNILRLVYPEDLGKALAVWDKDALMPELAGGSTFSTTYRLMFDGVPVYISCKVIRMMEGENDPHIVIGVSNVDAQMKREQELNVARERANRDSLTGVKSKHFYVETESEMDQKIAAGESAAFAVAVCDVNGLKTVNDTLGHAAGDQLIRDAAMEICNIFEHSPVFRYGGDEFVVLLRGRDWDRREALMRQLSDANRDNAVTGGPIIANGISDYVPGQDDCMAAVFARADAAMYENKKFLKGER